MSLDKIKAANAQLKSLLQQKDFQNPQIKTNIKLLKVSRPSLRS